MILLAIYFNSQLHIHQMLDLTSPFLKIDHMGLCEIRVNPSDGSWERVKICHNMSKYVTICHNPNRDFIAINLVGGLEHLDYCSISYME